MAVIAERIDVADIDQADQVELTDTDQSDQSEQIAQLSSRIVILQQQGHSLDRFPGNPDVRLQRNILQQQIRTLYRQIFALEQQSSRQRPDNYLSVALSMAAHAAHNNTRQFFAG